MSVPSSPAPCYQPDQTRVKLSNKGSSHVLRRVASVPNTTDYFKSNITSSSYSLLKQKVQVGPSDFQKVRLLGKGDVGKVYLVKHKETEKLYALKGNFILFFTLSSLSNK